jgi:D-aminoacyl-tRNA deacylase
LINCSSFGSAPTASPTYVTVGLKPGMENLGQAQRGRLTRPIHHPAQEVHPMRAVIQRVLRAHVDADGKTVGSINGPGLLVYLGVTHDDAADDIAWTARKIWELRLLHDERSASDVGAPVLVVSQFTLYGDARKGRRPTWQAAAAAAVSEPAYEAVCAELERLGAHVERGVFGADMRVESVNDGPVTLILDSRDRN